MDKAGLFAEGEAWEAARRHALEQAEAITTMDEAYDLVSEALVVSGGKHSSLQRPDNDTIVHANKETTDKMPSPSPSPSPAVEMRADSIVYVKLPAYSGTSGNDSLYVFTVYDFLCNHTEARGYIVDLRHNTGGNMYPMLAALSPLIPDGICFKFQGRKQTMPISIEHVRQEQLFKDRPTLNQTNVSKLSAQGHPVAVLTDSLTASSGEATLLAFRGLANARSFGSPTMGYASANMPYSLPDGSTLVLTTGRDVARTGEVFCDDPIQPDVLTDEPLQAALTWINTMLF